MNFQEGFWRSFMIFDDAFHSGDAFNDIFGDFLMKI